MHRIVIYEYVEIYIIWNIKKIPSISTLIFELCSLSLCSSRLVSEKFRVHITISVIVNALGVICTFAFHSTKGFSP